MNKCRSDCFDVLLVLINCHGDLMSQGMLCVNLYGLVVLSIIFHKRVYRMSDRTVLV
jgi:hypothetical protein